MKKKTNYQRNLHNNAPIKAKKEEKRNRILAFVLLGFMIFWTIASVLGLIAFTDNVIQRDSNQNSAYTIMTKESYNATAGGYQDSANGHSALEVRLDGLTGFMFYSPANSNFFVNDYLISYYYDPNVGPRLLFYYFSDNTFSVLNYAINSTYSKQNLNFDYFDYSADIDVYFGRLGVSPSINDYPNKVTYQPYYRVIDSVVLYGVNCGIEFFRPNGTYYTTYVWIATPSNNYYHVPLARGRLSTNANIFSTIPLAPLSYYDFAKNNYDTETIDELKAQIEILRDFANEQYNAGLDQGRINGYNDGYNAGYDDGISDTNQYTFSNLLGAVIDVPVNTFTNLFNFEIFGVNLTSFFLALLTFSLIIAIVKVFM